MIEEGIVQKFGNSSHLILPKRYIGRRLKILVETKRFYDIKSELLNMLNPYLEKIIGIYLYGSYARGEQTINSDIDILIITKIKMSIPKKIRDYSILSAAPKEIESALRKNAILVLPIIMEAKTIINPEAIEEYKPYKFNKHNTKAFVKECKDIIDFNKKGLELDFDLGSLVYSLMLRIRGLLIIKLMLENKTYYNQDLFSFLEKEGFSKKKISELYDVYSKEKEEIKIKSSKIILAKDIGKLLNVASNLLEEVRVLLS